MARRRFGAAVAATTLMVAACGSDGGESSGGVSGALLDDNGFAQYTGEPETGGVVRVLGGVDFVSLDPAVGDDGNVNNLYQLLYRQLTGYVHDPETDELTLVPDLATDLGTANQDATVWTFTLKDDVTFADGTPIRAQDVKFGIERAFDPSLAIGSPHLQNYIDGALEYPGVFEAPEGLDSIVVVDDQTIEFHLNQPTAAFPNVVATQPATPFPADQVASPGQIAEDPIESGPYVVDDYESGQSLTLVRNENWNRESDEIRPAYADGFEFQLGLDQNTIDQRMLAGQGEDANAVASSTNPLLAATLSQVQADPELMARTVQDLPNCTLYAAMDTTVAPLDDLRVRQAIEYAVDKTAVVNATGGPLLAEIATEMLNPSMPAWEEFDLYPTPEDGGDPEKARELLAEAGHPDGLELTMDVRALPKWQAQAEAVQQSLAEAGIDVTLNVIDAATYYEAVATPSQMNELAINGTCTGGFNSGIQLLTRFHGDNITEIGNDNMPRLDDQRINQRIDDITLIPDPDEQNAEFAELNREFMELAPVVPLIRETPLQMVGENVAGAYAHAGRTGYLDYGSLGLIDPER